MEPLTELLSRTQVRGAVFAHVVAAGSWGIHIDDGAPLGFHAVLAGEAWLSPSSGKPRRLVEGDVALLPEPGTFALTSEPQIASVSLEDARRQWQKDGHRIEIPGEGAQASLLCGGYRFEGDLFRRLLAGLPRVIHLRGSLAGSEGLRSCLQLVTRELQEHAVGEQVVLDRLLDIILIFSLRALRSTRVAPTVAWFQALGDAEVGRALLLMHDQPEHAWTVDELAEQVGISRATLAKRFKATVGVPPLSYLTGWRLQVAADLLRTSTMTVAAVARRSGYTSESAFSLAFKRKFGSAPGTFRHPHES